MDFGSTRVIQVTNIAPQATRDQMSTLFSFVGKIEDIRLYPTVRDASVTIQSRCCFIKFSDAACLGISQHLTNTVFIDRAIIIQPVPSGEVPEELEGLQMAQSGINKAGGSESKMPPNVTNTIDGSNIITHDPRLEAAGLPMYPPLPANLGQDKIEEIRRTVSVVGLDSTVSAQACMDFFAEAGEVKYFRYCTRENDPVKYALIEFSDQMSVVPALNMNDRQLGMSRIKVTHALMAITKPQAKSNEAALKEIEEAMSKVKEAQSLVSAAVDPLMGMLGGSKRSRSRSRSRRSNSRSRSYRRSRSRDRGYRRRSRSRSRRRSRSRERRRRSRSRSRDRKRRRSRSRSRDKRKRSRERRRSRSRSKRHDPKKEEETATKEEVKSSDTEVTKENGDSSSNGQPVETPKEENGKSTKRRTRSRSRHRSKSRERKRRSRTKSRERERRRRRSRSRDRKRRDRGDRDRDRKPKSPERTDKTNKISRDYDQEEKGFEKVIEKIEEKVEPEDMEISNSP